MSGDCYGDEDFRGGEGYWVILVWGNFVLEWRLSKLLFGRELGVFEWRLSNNLWSSFLVG